MAKGSGWANWKDRYFGKGADGRYIDTGKRGRESLDPNAVKDQTSLENFAENSAGPIQQELWQQELVTYSNEGAVVVQSAKVAQAANRLIEDTKVDGATAEYMIHSYQQRLKSMDRQTAIKNLNQDQAHRARAVLLAATVGRVRLTEAQRARLTEIAQGKFVALIERRYQQRAERGDLLGITPRKGSRTTNAADLAREAEFRQMVRERTIDAAYL